MLKEYQGILKDHQKANVIEPNDVFILRSLGDIKKMLEDY
jgi:hypothetical protein